MMGSAVSEVLQLLEVYYSARAEDVSAFVRPHPDEGGREALLVRQVEDTLELVLLLPARIVQGSFAELGFDERCQLIEGLSHFLLVCERVRSQRPTTELELELQAELDKWLVLTHAGSLPPAAEAQLRDSLYERCTYIQGEDTLHGARYRLANRLAARWVGRLVRCFVRRGRFADMCTELRRFYRLGQAEKLRLVDGPENTRLSA